jgi:uroporphyrinogen-III synthase
MSEDGSVTVEPDSPPEQQVEAVAAPPRRRLAPIAVALALLIVIGGAGLAWWLPHLRSSGGVARSPEPSSTAPPAPAEPPAESVAPPQPDPQVTERLDRLQSEIEALRDGGSSQTDIAELHNAVAALGRRLDQKAAETTADPAQLAALADSLKAATARLSRLESAMAQRQTDDRNDRTLTLAVGDIALALAGSGPYDAALTLARSAAGDDSALAADLDVLGRSAKTGLPGRVRLAQDLARLPAQLAEPEPPPPEAGFGQRIWSRVTGLVSIRRVDADDSHPSATPGPDRLIAEAEAQLAAGDLAGAVDTVRKLDGKAGRLAAPWLDAATARLDAERALQSLIATLAGRLDQGSGKTRP